MSRVCQVTNKGPMSGIPYRIRIVKLNVGFYQTLNGTDFGPSKNKFVRLKISSHGLRIIDKLGIDKIIANLEATGQKF